VNWDDYDNLIWFLRNSNF